MDYYELSLQRRQQIEEGLLELLRNQPYDKVTVTDIAAFMGMSRKSFYKYFSGKDDCLVSLFDRVILEGAIHVATGPVGHEDLTGVWQEFFRFWQTQRKLLEVVDSQQMERLLLLRYLHYFQTEERNQQVIPGLPLENRDEDVLSFYIMGLLTLLLSWCRRGCAPGVEEMAKKCEKLCNFGLNLFE